MRTCRRRGERGGYTSLRLAAGVALFLLAVPWYAGAQTITIDTLDDVADAPFDADGFCGVGTAADLPGADQHTSLREAIIAANNTLGAQSITFAPALAAGVIHITFDDADADTKPDPLPIVCADDTAINGDLDGDDVPDITLNGAGLAPTDDGLILISSRNTMNGLHLEEFPDAGIGVYHIAALAPGAVAADNAITNNVIAGGTYPVLVQAGGSDSNSPGAALRTTVTGNTLSGATFDGVLVFTGNAPTSSISDTLIAGNQVINNTRFGILISINFDANGADTRIARTTIRDNEVSGNESTGIAASAFQGQRNEITALVIDHNNVHDNGFGIGITAGVCAGSHNSMEATVSRNQLTEGLFAGGGSNFGCPPGPLANAADNTLMAMIADNVINAAAGTGITVAGGAQGAERNTVTAEVARNQVVALTGIVATGGTIIALGQSVSADNNVANVRLIGNRLRNSGAGISLLGGASGPNSSNRLEVQVEENAACGSILTDIQCYGGFPGYIGFPASQGTGNQVTGTIAHNAATKVTIAAGVAGNSCTVTQADNTACLAGDANCDRTVTAADVVEEVELVGDAAHSACGLDQGAAITIGSIFAL